MSLVACAALTGLLACRYGGMDQAGRLDAAVGGRIQDLLLGGASALQLLVHLGDPGSVAGLAALLIAACLAVRRWRGAVLVAVAVPVAAGLAKVLQPLVNRTLNGGVSFPSGHATGVFVLAAVFGVLLVNLPRPQLTVAVRVGLTVIATAVAVVVAAALVTLDDHYATDTLGGAALAFAVVLLTALGIDGVAGAARTVGRRADAARP